MLSPASISLSCWTTYYLQQSVSFKELRYLQVRLIKSYVTVPILPHYVHHDEESSSNRTITVAQNSLSNRYHSSGIEPITRPIDEDGQQFYPFVLQSSTVHFHIGRGYHPDAGDNSRLGFLLSLKAIVQLAANPLIAIFCRRRGFHSALLFGSLNIIGCTLRNKRIKLNWH